MVRNKRRLRYEARTFGRTIQEFRDHAQILLRCDDIVVLMPNKREKKGKIGFGQNGRF